MVWQLMAIRKILVATLGHVDHGKTSLLDKIRRTAVAKGEAGGITQNIGVSIIPIDVITKICGKLMDVFKGNVTIPGLLLIDTPGHAAFTSLRKRGGSLADIAILVVDINEGFKPQTLESIEILRAGKVPFVVAATKIDLIRGWSYDQSKTLIENINALDYKIQGEFEQKMYELVGKFGELGLQAERFDRVSDYTKQLAIIPLSAITGQGIPELLMVITGLAQKFLEQELHIDVEGPAKGTILEVKEEKGLGVTLDTIIYNGSIKVNDTIVIGGIDGAIVTKIRALLEPAELSDMRDRKSKFTQVKEAFAATGVKIAAPGLEKAIAGMPLRSCSPADINIIAAEMQQEVASVIGDESGEEGVIIKADTIGGLEALQHLLRAKDIPISSSSLGDITKKDISQLESLQGKDEQHAVILGFNVKIGVELEEHIKSKGLSIITSNIIYQIIEEYEKFAASLKQKGEIRELATLVRPCKFSILKGYVFRQNNPAVVGVEIEIGKIKTGDPIMNTEGKRISFVKSLQENQEAVSEAAQGKQVALAMDGVTVGRQINEGDYLYTDISEEQFKRFKELKRYLSAREIDVLKEVAEIKRKESPLWGMGGVA